MCMYTSYLYFFIYAYVHVNVYVSVEKGESEGECEGLLLEFEKGMGFYMSKEGGD